MNKPLWGWTREGWLIVGLFTATLYVFCAWVYYAVGPSEDAVRLLIRTTARTSLAVFIISFAARPLLQITRAPLARTLMRQRRYWGVSFFTSHMAHLFFIIVLIEGYYGGKWLEATSLQTLTFGGGVFVVLALMAITSTNGWYQRLGSKNWQRLHKFGAWYAWFIFTFTLTTGALIEGFAFIQTVEMVLLYGALILRIIAWRKTKTA